MTMRPIRTHADVMAVAPKGVEESLTLDFKANINRWSPPAVKPGRDEQLEMCRDVAQFANAVGGVVLIGIEDKQKRGTIKIAGDISPVNAATTMKGWIEQAIVNHLVRNTIDREVMVIACPAGEVVAINVPASRALVAVWDRDRSIEYPKRNSHGKFYMNPDEVERQRMDGSRAARIAIETASRNANDTKEARIVGGVLQRKPDEAERKWIPPSVQIEMAQETDWFVLRVSRGINSPNGVPVVHVPYGLVREAWVGEDKRINLLLSVRLVDDGESIELEP